MAVHAHEHDHTKLMHALTDGEDYELLFTVSPDDFPGSNWEITGGDRIK